MTSPSDGGGAAQASELDAGGGSQNSAGNPRLNTVEYLSSGANAVGLAGEFSVQLGEQAGQGSVVHSLSPGCRPGALVTPPDGGTQAKFRICS